MTLDPLYDRQIRALSPQTHREIELLHIKVIGDNYLSQELTKELVLLGVAKVVSDAQIEYSLTTRTERVDQLQDIDYVFVCGDDSNDIEAKTKVYLYLTNSELVVDNRPEAIPQFTDYLSSNIAACLFLYWFVSMLDKKAVFAPTKIPF